MSGDTPYITISDSDDIQYHDSQGQPFQTDGTQEQEADLVVGDLGSTGYQQAHNGCRSTQEWVVGTSVIIGYIVYEEKCNAPHNTAKDVEGKYPVIAKEGTEEVAEPVQIEHVEEYM
jgi:hypothetical protein